MRINNRIKTAHKITLELRKKRLEKMKKIFGEDFTFAPIPFSLNRDYPEEDRKSKNKQFNKNFRFGDI